MKRMQTSFFHYNNYIFHLEKLEISSNVIKKCWQDIVYEKTLEKAGVVHPHHFSSLMRPFIAPGADQPEPGCVVLKWLNLVAEDDWSEQG